MGSLMGNIFGSVADKSADETLAFSAMASAAAAASSYLIATLGATTPEVRRLFGEYLTQSVLAHEALMGLSVKKGWVNFYDTPVKQLQTALQTSEAVVSTAQ
ncbi:MAG: spore coat protein [Clostridia bacterium]|nr:spore coat protein [Clostridia bacterium]